MGGFVQLVLRKGVRLSRLKGSGVFLWKVAILGKELRMWGGDTGHRGLGRVGLVPLGRREMRCGPLNAAAAAS